MDVRYDRPFAINKFGLQDWSVKNSQQKKWKIIEFCKFGHGQKWTASWRLTNDKQEYQQVDKNKKEIKWHFGFSIEPFLSCNSAVRQGSLTLTWTSLETIVVPAVRFWSPCDSLWRLVTCRLHNYIIPLSNHLINQTHGALFSWLYVYIFINWKGPLYLHSTILKDFEFHIFLALNLFHLSYTLEKPIKMGFSFVKHLLAMLISIWILTDPALAKHGGITRHYKFDVRSLHAFHS